MKIKLETSLEKTGGTLSMPAWWTKVIAVPIPLALLATVVAIALGTTVVIFTFHASLSTNALPQAAPSAFFLCVDTTTQGAWKHVYGSAGYAVADDHQHFPSFAQVTLPDAAHSSRWIDQIDEPRALLKPTGTRRIASTWFGWTQFTIDLNLTDDKTHRLALYVVDWDSDARVENIDILDATTLQVLDHREISGFSDGEYLVWKVSGHINIRVIRVAGANAIINGLFLD